MARVEAAARRSIDAADPNALAMLNRTGGIEKHDRPRRWFIAHHDQFAAAMPCPTSSGRRTELCWPEQQGGGAVGG